MKKFIFVLTVAASSLAFVNCSSDDDKGSAVDCYQLAQNIADASQAYMQNQSTANCNALRDAYQAAIDADCPGASTYQGQLDLFDCE